MTARTPSTDEKAARRRLLETFASHPIDELIRPSRGLRFEVEAVGNDLVPLLINDGDQGHRLPALASPEAHYLAYPLVEARRRAGRLLAGPLVPLRASTRLFARLTAFDRVVFVNHWLFVPGPRLEIPGTSLEELVGRLRAGYPDHALVFPGITPAFDPMHGRLLRDLRALGGVPQRRRHVHLFDPNRNLRGRRRRKLRSNIQKDFKHHERARPSMIDERSVLVARAPEIRVLYEQLYLDKYDNGLNAEYRDNFFRILLASPLFHSAAWVGDDGRLEAFCCALHTHDTMPWSVCGYDREAPIKRGLFRLAYAHDLGEARATDRMFHLGGGNDDFKRLRGALPAFELDVVFDDHLVPRRRIPWGLLRRLRPDKPIQRSTKP